MSSTRPKRSSSPDVGVTIERVAEAIDTGPLLRAQRIVHVALAMGPTLFGAVVVFLALTQPVPPTPGDEELVDLLSFVHPLLLVSAVLGGFVVRRLLIRNAAAKAVDLRSVTAEAFLMGMAQANLIRFSLVEGIALFGLVICLIAQTSGLLEGKPEYWANAVTLLVLHGFAVACFPTRQRWLDTAEQALAEARLRRSE
ncbi:MAG: hypothetical protein KDC87_06965 [Planctomycetes bacterium]|nr:hypothetical protein [Planctomycetota bacterium]MCB9870033.1 hypothetical protein [Planctomycetota bacterium]